MWAIQDRNGTYFQKYVPLGPMFGVPLEHAATFKTKQEADIIQARDWRFNGTKTVKVTSRRKRAAEAKRLLG